MSRKPRWSGAQIAYVIALAVLLYFVVRTVLGLVWRTVFFLFTAVVALLLAIVIVGSVSRRRGRR